MSNIAIKVENLGKKYLIKHEKQESYKTFQDVLINSGKKIITTLNPFGKSSASEDGTVEEFWALKDVNFEINKGDKVGIIGRNGAGKSTLLKVLSRITEPTTGKIHINGRIASLLEVGTGFHPELTGRENIYLNGAILGMSRAEIKSKFDEIVAFAEIEKFLDTPVKRYSSGMYVRLAFSVAAHLESEILVIDEVLAVGDADFQKKCLGKMNQVSREGRTILFVSHNMGVMKKLCNKAILLSQGIIDTYGSVDKVIQKYLSDTDENNCLWTIHEFIKALPTDPNVQILDINITQNSIGIKGKVSNSKSIEVQIEYQVNVKTKGLLIFIRLCDLDETLIFHSINGSSNAKTLEYLPGIYRSRLVIPGNILAPRTYLLQIGASIYKKRRIIPEWFNTKLNALSTNDIDSACPEIESGLLLPDYSWETKRITE